MYIWPSIYIYIHMYIDHTQDYRRPYVLYTTDSDYLGRVDRGMEAGRGQQPHTVEVAAGEGAAILSPDILQSQNPATLAV